MKVGRLCFGRASRWSHAAFAWVATVAVGLVPATSVRADPGYYVLAPYDNDGLRVVDLRYWTVKHHGEPEVIWPEVGLGYGINSRWMTELLYSTIGPANWDIVPSSLAWQNEWLLTQGEWPIDLALHASLIREAGVDGRIWSIEYGPLLQTDWGRTQLNANVLFERRFEPDDTQPIQMKYQWQIRHRWHPLMNFGLQGFGELGPWSHWDEAGRQSHRAGPALFGHVDLGDGDASAQTLAYQAAYLLGSVYRRRGSMFTVRVQWQF
ncbi:hypothetical protein AACH06_07140 [Ideonella sp. DXS29W]|uniref:DUF2490 domain-containing protein n=1 Tax=Ideonella lacteola TaxID=2984193 RepID=A0ABU9BPZ9_9BURK